MDEDAATIRIVLSEEDETSSPEIDREARPPNPPSPPQSPQEKAAPTTVAPSETRTAPPIQEPLPIAPEPVTEEPVKDALPETPKQAGVSKEEYQTLVKQFGPEQAKAIAETQGGIVEQAEPEAIAKRQPVSPAARPQAAPQPAPGPVTERQTPSVANVAETPPEKTSGPLPVEVTNWPGDKPPTSAGEAEPEPPRETTPGPSSEAFNPQEKAKEQFEGKVKAEQVRMEYEALYGQSKGALDKTLDFAKSIRGTLGGTFGTLVGAALDVGSFLGDMRSQKKPETVEAEKRQREEAPQAKGPEISKDTVERLKTESAPKPASQPAVEAAPKAATAEVAATGAKVAAGAGEATAGAASGAARAAAGAAEAAGGSLAAAGAAAAAVVAPLAAVAAVAVGVVVAMNALEAVIDPLVERFAQYNPEVAQAQAMAELRQTLGDIRRADEAGPDLAQYIESQSNMQQKWQDLVTGFLTKLMPIAEGLMDLVSSLMPVIQGLLVPVEFILKIIGWIFSILKWFRDNQDEETASQFFNFNPLTDITAPAASL